MVTGSLQIKKNTYYAVLNLVDEGGRRRQKWISTGYSVNGHNKRAAAKTLDTLIAEYDDLPKPVAVSKDMPFTEYAEKWLDTAACIYDPITYQGYRHTTEKHIIPYFKKTNLKLREIDADTVQAFAAYLSKKGNLKTGGGLSNKSVRNYLTVLSQIFNDAVGKKKIAENPVHGVKRPKKQKYNPSFYAAEQMRLMLSAIEGEPLAPMIRITALYGLRRSELLGLKWSSIDFENKEVTIQSVVSRFSTIVEKDDTKTEDSRRTYPMTPAIERIFRDAKEREERNREMFGDSYIENDYVFKWDDGRPYTPDYVTRAFKKLLKRHDMPVIRLHDLRHSCATILLESGHNLKDVKDWLGHADIQTTGNIYGHLTKSHLRTVGNDICGEIL